MPLRPRKAFFSDFVFNVGENVYEPSEDSFLFAVNLTVNPGDYVLDMGTGCGILGLVAAVKASEVVAIDVNPFAIRCARDNSRLSHVADKMRFLQGDLFTPLRADERFDLILFNAPYLPAEHMEGNSWLERAWAGGVTGRQVIDRFISGCGGHLRRSGRILLLLSTLSNVAEALEGFGDQNLRARVIVESNLPFFETLVLLEAKF